MGAHVFDDTGVVTLPCLAFCRTTTYDPESHEKVPFPLLQWSGRVGYMHYQSSSASKLQPSNAITNESLSSATESILERENPAARISHSASILKLAKCMHCIADMANANPNFGTVRYRGDKIDAIGMMSRQSEATS